MWSDRPRTGFPEIGKTEAQQDVLSLNVDGQYARAIEEMHEYILTLTPKKRPPPPTKKQAEFIRYCQDIRFEISHYDQFDHGHLTCRFHTGNSFTGFCPGCEKELREIE